jgi:lysyl-tRNA synthetase class 2
MPDREESLLANRAAKLDRLRNNGIDPYPPRFTRTFDTANAVKAFEAAESGEQPQDTTENVSVAGRIVSMRVMGKAAFLDLQDATGGLQALMRQNNLNEGFEILKDLDIGDHLGVTGNLIRTRTGEVTIDALQLTVTAKGLRPLPEKFHGLRDTETRYRQRYLDLIANRDIMPVFELRSKVISGIRRFLDNRGFLEVDTPILVPVAAGAHARPFVTHHNALDEQLYLRIATELYLKRLIIGGFDKVYELGRVFRNEGIDQDHNPEFTLLESYEAYADYNDVMSMVEEMVSQVAIEALGSPKVAIGEQVIDFTPPWQRVHLREELNLRSGIDIDSSSDEELQRRAAALGVDTGAGVRESRGRLIDKLLSALVEPHLVQPTFVLDYPEEMSPLAKSKPGAPGYVERFEAFAFGMEIANAYSELNDPQVQRERFEAQEEIRRVFQDEEVDRKDDDFLTAMEYGMPPTGGLGIGIDRLVMLLSGQTSIRDVVLFPQMRSITNAELAEPEEKTEEGTE